MTYVEFFDTTEVENLCTCLVQPPERVILIGGDARKLGVHAERYRRIMADRGHTVEFVCRGVNRNKLQDIVAELERIVTTYNDCVFDLTGGEDLYLVAVGIVWERYRDRGLQMHRFNGYTGTICDCDLDGETIAQGIVPSLTVEENIRIYGGEVIRDEEKACYTYEWDMNEEFCADIDAIWRICRADTRLWNRQIGVLKALAAPSESLAASAEQQALIPVLQQSGGVFVWDDRVLRPLTEQGYLTVCEYDGEHVSVAFKNEQIKRCLTKEGQALEMKIYRIARECQEKGVSVYDDVMNGVAIDWDGKVHTDGEARDTQNEIDVMMMHGIIPVFVSCKNGFIDMDELYKLSAVADEFGAKYAKKVLVATGLEYAGGFALDLRQRAADMGIRVVEGVQRMTDEELIRVVKSLWFN